MKMKFSTLLNVVLATFLVTSLIYNVVVSRSADWEPLLPYDPWADWNDDGEIDVFDKVAVGARFGSSGTPITKATIEYDSGWLNITDKTGQYFNITHNLNSTDIIVDITGKTTIDSGVHQRHLGGTDYTPEWWRIYGGTNEDRAYSVVQTCDGGYAMAGHTYSWGEGAADFWLAKTDWTGHIQWNKTYGHGGDDFAKSIIQTSDGGYAIAGYNSSGTYMDYWLVKTDHTGSVEWNQTYGEPGDKEFAYSLIQTSDGGYAIWGYKLTSGDVKTDAWMVKTNSNGEMEWNQTYGGADDEVAWSVIQTCDGGYAGLGYTKSFGAVNWDVWLVKVYANGTEQWNHIYGGSKEDFGFSIIQTKDGGFAIGGFTYSFGAGHSDFYLIKTFANGTMQWQRTYGDGDYDDAYSIIQTRDWGYALAGQSGGVLADSKDAWLVKTDASGNKQWDKYYGGSFDDNWKQVIRTIDGGYALVGWTKSFGTGSHDFWLVKIGSESGLAWTDSTADTVTLYRGATDPYWNYVRVRIWKIKTP